MTDEKDVKVWKFPGDVRVLDNAQLIANGVRLDNKYNNDWYIYYAKANYPEVFETK